METPKYISGKAQLFDLKGVADKIKGCTNRPVSTTFIFNLFFDYGYASRTNKP